ncbi:MAG: menaquinone biosynthesis protein [Verrucomicrobiales bacterium]|nr:menaquinone biosynthesis protein [Verrucomicrobiales bacterium]
MMFVPPPLPPLRAGSVPYLNVAPIVRGLEGRLRLLPPAQLADALRQGEIDAGLLSITEALYHPEYVILDGPCVASNGPVYSVILTHRRPLNEVREVCCHQASLASVNLLRVLLAEQGLKPRLIPLPDPEAAAHHDFALLIGDPAIEFRRRYPSHPIVDLGTAWRDLTGLPFVYAVWTLRRDADTTTLRTELLRAFERGQRELEAVVRESAGFDESFRRRYLTEHVTSSLGAAEKSGIAKFVELLRRHQPDPVHLPKYVR